MTKPKAAARSGGAGTRGNPLLAKWTAPFELPPFERIEPKHFRPAIDKAIADHKAEVEKILSNAVAPTFANTVGAMEKAGALLTRVLRVFYNLTSAHTNPELQAIERDIAPILSKHGTEISLDPRLFERVDAIFKRGTRQKLDDEQRRVLERTHAGLVRAGAKLGPEAKQRMSEINARLATLGTTFAQNVLADEQAYKLILEDEADLAGLPDFVRAAAKRAGDDLGHPGKHVITLARSSIESFLQFSTRRDLREAAFAAWVRRGEGGGEHDNRAVATEILSLRAERARLLGYDTFAKFRLEDAMAKTPEAVRGLLDEVWTAAVKKAGEERALLQAQVDSEGGNFQIEAWDWRHYAEKVRKAKYDLDEGEIKPYLQLDQMIAAAFDTATRLFGITFTERTDLPKYHPDVRTWEVKRADGSHLGVFIGDYFARPSKRSGAWMSAFRGQQKLKADIRPIIVNVLNFARGAASEPTLLSFTDARTLFHEFGHALHGLLSDVTYPSIAGTAVSTDFVELPSQLYEHWLEEPDVLKRFARHHKTGEPMPDELLKRLKAANTFNQGFSTIEYVSSALADMELHALGDFTGFDLSRFEAEMLKRIGMPREIVMRHRLPHFSHIFSGGGYAAGYYSYMWSEVMDADAFDAFEETGNAFDPATAKKLSEFIYSAGNRRDPAEAYTAFRGRLPTPVAMMRNRGLV
jgi:peptidyl-dipeptidase Dcp